MGNDRKWKRSMREDARRRKDGTVGGEQLWREQNIGMDGGWGILGEVSTLSHLASSSDSLPWASPHRYP